MPTTRKKKIKTVYKEDDSEGEKSVGDFSDSGSEAEIPEASSSDEAISDDDFEEVPVKTFSKAKKQKPVKKTKFAKAFLNKLNKQSDGVDDAAMEVSATPALFSVKDLTEEDKLLPSFLDLSESDSSDDDSPKAAPKKSLVNLSSQVSDDEMQVDTEYKDVWSQNIHDNSEEVAKRTFLDLEKQKLKAEETKESILNYNVTVKNDNEEFTDVKDLLAMGEEVKLQSPIKIKKNRKTKKAKDDSDSEVEDWEEVNEAQQLPQQGIQLVVDFPDAQYRKKKTIDVEMMMKRKINKVKKEYQVYMHKVHVLCWLGHGNYVSRILNDQEVLSAALSLVPSKECYPGERVDMKYVEQITSWFKDKLTLKQDKNEEKFRAKALPLKEILKNQIKTRIVTAKKYLVFIFVSMLRALGLQCRVMFNFTTLPIRPPSSELCSLSTKQKDEKKVTEDKEKQSKSQVKKKKCIDSKTKAKKKISQFDGNCDSSYSESDNSFDSDIQDMMQLDGNDDKIVSTRTRKTRTSTKENTTNEDVSPPKRAKHETSNSVQDVKNTKISKPSKDCINSADNINVMTRKRGVRKKSNYDENKSNLQQGNASKSEIGQQQNKKTRKGSTKMEVDMESTSTLKSPHVPNLTEPSTSKKTKQVKVNKKINLPEIIVTQEDENSNVSSEFFDTTKLATKRLSLSRTRTQTANPSSSKTSKSQPDQIHKDGKSKLRARSAPGNTVDKSKYFENNEATSVSKKSRYTRATEAQEDKQRVSHRDILAKTKKPNNDVTGDLVDIIKMRVKEAKAKSKKGKIKGKIKESDVDSDYLPDEEPKRRKSESDDDFKPKKISPRPSTSKVVKKIDRRVLSSDSDDLPKNKIDFWCEVFVEELEQWIAVDVIKAKAHCTNEIYSHATHPVCYIVGWDNNNFLKDLTRRYVPHWNTVTRKQRAEPVWWETAIKPWLGPKTARDREEDEQLDRMQLDAPLPKSISEYKNHPLYALKRHLLKFEAIYPPDAATLGFVRNEPVYARECVYVCHSRDIWLKEAKVVRLGEKPYKIVKARPKWDRLSNKLITDKPLEIFGPWQVDDYEPPVAENGVVPRNAYGNVELFKECMLPKGTVHIKLPSLNRVAKKLNIDCAPAMTGFDFNGGWSHPVYDGFVVCQEFEQIITEAWLKDQEEQERREREKLENRVYGNWKRLIKGLFIRERLKNKYGFDDPKQPEKKNKGPKLVVKKK